MADRPRFGPAGTPLVFKNLKIPIEGVPRFLHNEGLDAFEYQATRWGPKPQMKKEKLRNSGPTPKHMMCG